MTSLTIFLTGATGFLGGTVLTQFWTDAAELFHSGRQPLPLSINLKCLVRTEDTAEKLRAAYPPTSTTLNNQAKLNFTLTTVVGDLDASDILKEEATKADIIIHCSDCDHYDSAHALVQGVAANPQSSTRPTPQGKAVIFHVSGAGNTMDTKATPHGTRDPTIYSDKLDDPNSIPPLKLPLERMHAKVEQSIAPYADENGVHLVQLSPAIILGQGRGRVGKTETFPVPWYKAMLSHGAGLTISPGENLQSASSVDDVARAIIFFIGEALDGGSNSQVPSRLEWGGRGYYFIESRETGGLERAQHVASRLHREGKFETDKVDLLDRDAATEKFGPMAPFVAGHNMRSRAERLKGLGWKPRDLDWGHLIDEGTGERV